MHLVLDLPDLPERYERSNIYLFAGLVPIARRLVGKEWEVKVKDCSRCGKCCERMTNEDHPIGGPDGCRFLRRSPGEQMCGLEIYRPHGCAIANGERVGVDDCSVEWGPA